RCGGAEPGLRQSAHRDSRPGRSADGAPDQRILRGRPRVGIGFRFRGHRAALVRDLMASLAFSASPPAQRLTALLDTGSLARGQAQAFGSLITGVGTIAGVEVTVIATDRHVAGGSLGVAESQALASLMKESQATNRPFLM